MQLSYVAERRTAVVDVDDDRVDAALGQLGGGLVRRVDRVERSQIGWYDVEPTSVSGPVSG